MHLEKKRHPRAWCRRGMGKTKGVGWLWRPAATRRRRLADRDGGQVGSGDELKGPGRAKLRHSDFIPEAIRSLRRLQQKL